MMFVVFTGPSLDDLAADLQLSWRSLQGIVSHFRQESSSREVDLKALLLLLVALLKKDCTARERYVV